jgi:hypothetical protein
MIRLAAALLLAATLAACGSKATLSPPPGQQLPVAAYGQDHRPGADELLEPPEQAAPERSVELRRRSQEREDDPFDIPPEG